LPLLLRRVAKCRIKRKISPYCHNTDFQQDVTSTSNSNFDFLAKLFIFTVAFAGTGSTALRETFPKTNDKQNILLDAEPSRRMFVNYPLPNLPDFCMGPQGKTKTIFAVL
jgi:hypothetical protein